MRIEIEIETPPGIGGDTITYRDVIDLIDKIAPTDHRLPIPIGGTIVANRHGTLYVERTA